MADPTPNPLAQAITETATKLGISPVDLATAISYETGGTFDPWKAGPTTQWGQHRGLIQWGEPQAKQYGVHKDMPVADQVAAAGKYLTDRGVKPGHGLMEIYSAINAGSVGLNHRSDANNGGAPGTVADKVNYQMHGHRAKAERLLGGAPMPVQTAANPASAPQAAAGAVSPNSMPAYGWSPNNAPTATAGAQLSQMMPQAGADMAQMQMPPPLEAPSIRYFRPQTPPRRGFSFPRSV